MLNIRIAAIFIEFFLECVYIIHVGHYKNMYYEHY